MIDQCEAETISTSFAEQLETAEILYGQHLSFSFGSADVRALLLKADIYPEEVRERVYSILMNQRRKYSYLFD